MYNNLYFITSKLTIFMDHTIYPTWTISEHWTSGLLENRLMVISYLTQNSITINKC